MHAHLRTLVCDAVHGLLMVRGTTLHLRNREWVVWRPRDLSSSVTLVVVIRNREPPVQDVYMTRVYRNPNLKNNFYSHMEDWQNLVKSPP